MTVWSPLLSRYLLTVSRQVVKTRICWEHACKSWWGDRKIPHLTKCQIHIALVPSRSYQSLTDISTQKCLRESCEKTLARSSITVCSGEQVQNAKILLANLSWRTLPHFVALSEVSWIFTARKAVTCPCKHCLWQKVSNFWRSPNRNRILLHITDSSRLAELQLRAVAKVKIFICYISSRVRKVELLQYLPTKCSWITRIVVSFRFNGWE